MVVGSEQGVRNANEPTIATADPYNERDYLVEVDGLHRGHESVGKTGEAHGTVPPDGISKHGRVNREENRHHRVTMREVCHKQGNQEAGSDKKNNSS